MAAIEPLNQRLLVARIAGLVGLVEKALAEIDAAKRVLVARPAPGRALRSGRVS